MSYRHILARWITPLVFALGLLVLAGCSPAARATANPGGAVLRLSDETLRLMPATANYADAAGPLYSGQYAPDDLPPPDELVVVTYNLRYAEDIEGAIEAFSTMEPLPAAGILLLQEMDAAGVEALAAALQMDYVYFPASVAEDGEDFGNAILSRWPLSEPAKIILPGRHPLTDQQRTATRAVAHIGGREVLAYSTHIETATAPESLRVAQMEAVLADIPDEAGAVIVGGDFNTITGRGVEELAERYAAGDLTHATPGGEPTVERFGMRPSAADHLFTRGFVVREAGVLGEVEASDHFPVWARLGWGE